ncbi:transporter [Gelidibacter japonicus]|uniref:transporter n=1 Tax=Gelidibacter japonicus TaxID=1962232 RepID=UPI0013D3AA56|nr:transporter [Gelidibacter japonicus]
MKKIALLCTALFIVNVTFAQDQPQTDTAGADALAKQLQNPISSLISVPFQGNFDFGFGPENGNRSIINIQPVIPLSIGEDWNLITRIILPVVSQSDIYGNSGNQFGLGDVSLSGFFSPKEPTSGGLIWGVGPVLSIPTATDNLLGSQKFGVGPTAVALKQVGTITVGLLVNQVWSVAGNEDRADVNNTFIQPFLAKNFPGGYALSLNTEVSQNWEADATSGTVNIGGSKVIALGKQRAQISVGPRIPYGGGNNSDWGFRAQFTLLFPAGK